MLSLCQLACLTLLSAATTDQRPTLAQAQLVALDERLQQLAEQFEIPGMSAAVVYDGKVAWSQGYGHANPEVLTFAEPTTRYRIASVSKPFAALLIMQAVEQELLALDDPMSKFQIHKWFAPDPARYTERPIRVRHVLSHTSEGVPGDAYSYNGNIFIDLTWVLEHVTRLSYPKLLQERIFDRLEMNDSFPGHTEPGGKRWVEMTGTYAWTSTGNTRGKLSLLDPDPTLDASAFDPVYAMPDDALAARRELLGDNFHHLNAGCTSSGIVTTVLDLAKFDIALDRNLLVSEESKQLMFAPTVANDGKELPYGLGWFTQVVDEKRVLWHYGWSPPTVSALYVKVPEERITFLLLANNDRLSANMAWSQLGVQASPFAQAFLQTLVP